MVTYKVVIEVDAASPEAAASRVLGGLYPGTVEVSHGEDYGGPHEMHVIDIRAPRGERHTYCYGRAHGVNEDPCMRMPVAAGVRAMAEPCPGPKACGRAGEHP